MNVTVLQDRCVYIIQVCFLVPNKRNMDGFNTDHWQVSYIQHEACGLGSRSVFVLCVCLCV